MLNELPRPRDLPEAEVLSQPPPAADEPAPARAPAPLLVLAHDDQLCSDEACLPPVEPDG